MDSKEAIEEMDTKTVGEMVAEDYRTAEVFKKFGIEFCCGGKVTLENTCQKRGIDINAVQDALESLDNQVDTSAHDYNNWELDKLIDHIVNTHHSYVNAALSQLDEYSAKVAKVHGNGNPEVVEIYHHYQAIANELRMHMHKEEAILFPYIRTMVVANRYGEALTPPPFGSVKFPIDMMESEHVSAGNAMESIKQLSNDFSPPEHACNTYRVLYAKLQEFESDLHQHIHLENNILFPKAIQMETDLLR
ncbi:MAG: iron-sulfur cluster repair di-iron protein [Bacteroidetes bacterium]|nr:MAG: iron-sulfur cluster repair di-iron protein [Bacteroidota bacterium]